MGYWVKAATTTDDRGEYVLERVRPGQAYVLMAEKRDWPMPPIHEAPGDPKLRKPVLSTTYYPNSEMLEGAIPLVLRPGERRDTVDIVMSRSLFYCLSGMVQARGRPSALHFSIVEQSLSLGDARRPGGQTGADGKIRICGLQPGQYRVIVHESSPTPAGDPPLFGATIVAITDRDIDNVNVETQAGVPILGRAIWEGAPPDEPITTKLWLSLTPLRRSYFTGEKLDAKLTIPGEFLFPSVMLDDYLVQADGALPTGVYVKDILYAATSVKNVPFRVGSALGNVDLRIVIARDGGGLTVKTSDEDGNPAPDAGVLIMPSEVRSEAELAATLISGQTDQEGFYAFTNLAPGKYRVLTTNAPVDNMPESINPETISRLWRARSGKASEVEISPGVVVRLTLKPAVFDD
jgi:hypothetical protein